jgi:CO/xanthine dehydrogenase FAD-binding subunit
VLKIKSRLGASAPVVAGGTDLIVNLKHRLASPAAVISLKNIKEMTGIEAKPDSVVIKAGTSLAQTTEDEAVRKHFPILTIRTNFYACRQGHKRSK